MIAVQALEKRTPELKQKARFSRAFTGVESFWLANCPTGTGKSRTEYRKRAEIIRPFFYYRGLKLYSQFRGTLTATVFVRHFRIRDINSNETCRIDQFRELSARHEYLQ